SALADALERHPTVVVSVLGWEHRGIAEAFAGTAPAPGGAFRLGTWTETEWGPALDGAVSWLGARLVDGAPRHAGWALLVEAAVEHVVIGEGSADPLVHVRGRYRTS
ncbi:MAG: flavin reductase, partial [Nocardioidaceae bacterium]